MYDAMILIQVNQVQGHQYPKRMHAPRRHQPYAFVVPKLQPPNKSPQARKNSICSRDRKAQEGFSGLVVHAIFLSLHSSRLWRVLTGPALTTALLIPCNPSTNKLLYWGFGAPRFIAAALYYPEA